MSNQLLRIDFENARADVLCFDNGTEVKEYHAMIHVSQQRLTYAKQLEAVMNAYQVLLDRLPDTYPVYGTFLDGKDIYKEELTPGGLIVMGNEGNGISDEVRQRINRRLLIPDFHQGETADSLNVAIATAITCSEFRRRAVRG